jgi:hypothetical protein
MITLYSTGCPKCKVLEKKLTDKGLEFTIISDVEQILKAADKANTDFTPILEVNNNFMDYQQAEVWIGDKTNE